jgi:hypothetical protein
MQLGIHIALLLAVGCFYWVFGLLYYAVQLYKSGSAKNGKGFDASSRCFVISLYYNSFI